MDSCSISLEKDRAIFLSQEKKTKWVALITFITMVVEISVGHWSGSMSLLADGWHMASHTLALFLSVVVYYLYRHPRFRASFTFGGGKILSLGGYTSAVFLILIAVSMIYESFLRFYEGRVVHYNEALGVAVLGLLVNLLCAYVLHHKEDSKSSISCSSEEHHHHHHEHHHHDHNHQSAYIHILTDALTSGLAIFALLLGKWNGLHWADPAVGILGGLVVLRWSLGLIKESGRDLLDAHDLSIDRDNLVKKLELDGSQVVDIHLWKLAPGQVGCELIIRKNLDQKSSYYRDLLLNSFHIHHLVIEVI